MLKRRQNTNTQSGHDLNSISFGLLVGLLLSLTGLQPLADSPSFLSEVRPILSTHCFKCHGPDAAARKAGLRLDISEGTRTTSDSGRLILQPGEPDQSELFHRITSTDPDEIMPPTSTKQPLSAAQTRILTEWIRNGGQYEDHWAWKKPSRPALPEIKNRAWPRNPIDYFILAKMEAAGMSPAPLADPAHLLRRLHLDLVGLPPDLSTLNTFVHNPSIEAYEAIVDGLLSSPRYGERWARKWLDLARYSDTNGYEKDRDRSIWPYRDWVIHALNQDMPFDRFTIEQLAGDMLQESTVEQKIATGFHRNTMLNEEGGIDPLEYRYLAMVDRVNTTATTWLGLTLGCAQCHTHKYDPIQHDEYFSFMALLNNADEPSIQVPEPGVDAKREEIKKQIERLKRQLPELYPRDNSSPALAGEKNERLEKDFNTWLEEQSNLLNTWIPLEPASAQSSLPYLKIEEDATVFAGGDMSKSDTYTLTFKGVPEGVTAIRLEALADERLPAGGPGHVYYEGPVGDFWLSNIKAYEGPNEIGFSSASQSFANGSNTADKVLDDNLQSGWSINGGQGRDHHAVFVFEATLEQGGDLIVEMLFERYYAAGLGRFRISVTSDPAPHPAHTMPIKVQEDIMTWKKVNGPEANDRIRDRLLAYFLETTPLLEEARAPLRQLENQIPQSPTTLVFQERPPLYPRPTFRHHRGEFLQPKEEVEPGIPAFLKREVTFNPTNRLELAKWLVSEDNPLTAQVQVNRHWDALFGNGLVGTLGDFGFQGDLPTHPKLLDWLAVEFMENQWSTKKLHKLMVMSATYRQSSAAEKSKWTRDPSNLLLARAPRFRLEAEVVRDSILDAAALLTHRIGGPSVFPPQPASVTTEGAYRAMKWEADTDADRYRRSIYTYSKRTNPFAMYTTFDAPSGEACLADRDRSNTPLQALTLLNDKMFVEASQSAGRQANDSGKSVEETATDLFRTFLSRPPTPSELSSLVTFYLDQKERFTEGDLDPTEIISQPSSDDKLASQAAWTTLARVLINLDETIVRN